MCVCACVCVQVLCVRVYVTILDYVRMLYGDIVVLCIHNAIKDSSLYVTIHYPPAEVMLLFK